MLRKAGLITLLSGLLQACAVISSHDNAAQLHTEADRQQAGAATWRRGEEAERQARDRIQALVGRELTPESAIEIALLAHPEVQLAFETLEISRSELVEASTISNPVGIVGTRRPSGNFSAFFPDRNVSVGILQNVVDLIDLPIRRRIAGAELERARLEAAERIVAHAAQVNEAYIQYVAALSIDRLRQEAVTLARGTLELIRQEVEGEEDGEEALLEARTATVQVEAAALRASLEAESARARLAQLMGIAGTFDDWRLGGALPPLPDADPPAAALETSALERRLDVRAARRALATRLDAAGVRRRWRWLGALELGAFRESASGGTRFTGPNAVVELPLFDQRQAEILAADAEARAAARRLEATTLAARSEVRTHAAELATVRLLLANHNDSLVPTLVRLEGLAPAGSLGARRARMARIDAEEARVELLRDYWRAKAALARAAGDWQALPATITVQGPTLIGAGSP